MEGNNTEPKVTMVDNATPEPTKGGILADIVEAVKENWKSWLVTGLLAAGSFAAGWKCGKDDCLPKVVPDTQEDASYDVGDETAV